MEDLNTMGSQTQEYTKEINLEEDRDEVEDAEGRDEDEEDDHTREESREEEEEHSLVVPDGKYVDHQHRT